jgi:hypothetical protein
LSEGILGIKSFQCQFPVVGRIFSERRLTR